MKSTRRGRSLIALGGAAILAIFVLAILRMRSAQLGASPSPEETLALEEGTRPLDRGASIRTPVTEVGEKTEADQSTSSASEATAQKMLRVVNAFGEPVRGVRLRVSGAGEEDYTSHASTFVADGQGIVRLFTGSESWSSIRIEVDGHAILTDNYADKLAEPMRQVVTLMVTELGTLECKGANHAGQEVGVTFSGRVGYPDNWSALGGDSAELRLPPGEYWVWLRERNGKIPTLVQVSEQPITATIGSGERTELVLPETTITSLSLRVQDSSSKTRIAGARITYYGQSDGVNEEGVLAEWISDQEGLAEIKVVNVIGSDDNANSAIAEGTVAKHPLLFLAVEHSGYANATLGLRPELEPGPLTLELDSLEVCEKLSIALGELRGRVESLSVQPVDLHGNSVAAAQHTKLLAEPTLIPISMGLYQLSFTISVEPPAHARLLMSVPPNAKVVNVDLHQLVKMVRVEGGNRNDFALEMNQVQYTAKNTKTRVEVFGQIDLKQTLEIPVPVATGTVTKVTLGGDKLARDTTWPTVLELGADSEAVSLSESIWGGVEIAFEDQDSGQARPYAQARIVGTSVAGSVGVQANEDGRAYIRGMPEGEYLAYMLGTTAQLPYAALSKPCSFAISHESSSSGGLSQVYVECSMGTHDARISGRVGGIRTAGCYAVVVQRYELNGGDLVSASSPVICSVDSVGKFHLSDLSTGHYRFQVLKRSGLLTDPEEVSGGVVRIISHGTNEIVLELN